MDWLKFFKGEQKTTASTAKERLKLVVAHQREGRANGPSWLPRLREELISVVRKYVAVPENAVNVQVQREDGLEVLEMNIALPDVQR